MDSWAKRRRLTRLQSSSGSYIWLAFDHGLTFGAQDDIADISSRLELTTDARVSGVVLNRGLVRMLPPDAPCGLVLQSFGFPKVQGQHSVKVPIATVREAAQLGAEAVAIELNLNLTGLDRLVQQAAAMIGDACDHHLPTLAMVTPSATADAIRSLADAIRISTELGADIIKVGLNDQLMELRSSHSLKTVAAAISNAPPVLLAGGPAESDISTKISLARGLGFQGVCVGRHLFGDPIQTQNILREIHSAFGEG